MDNLRNNDKGLCRKRIGKIVTDIVADRVSSSNDLQFFGKNYRCIFEII